MGNMDMKQVLNKQTTVKTTIGFVAIVIAVIVSWSLGWQDLRGSVSANEIQVNGTTERVQILENTSVETRLRLAEIQTSLKGIQTTLERLEASR